MSTGQRDSDAGSVPRGFWSEFADSISPRAAGLVAGVLVLQLGFILSYVGAFHAPKPHRIPVAVVAPSQLRARAASELDAVPAQALHATAASSLASAQTALRHGSVDGVVVLRPSATSDSLLIASGAGASLAGALEELIKRVDAGRRRTVAVTDAVPLQAGDNRGLTGFYLVIGWLVGGYLAAALLGVAKGSRPATPRRALIRLLSLVPYSILSGLGGAVIVGPLLGALTGHLLALWWIGALLVFTASAVTMAFQALLGVIGIGATVLLFVVLGNPSAGGAYQAPLLPAFWRALGPALPNGAGVSAVRSVVYFQAHDVTGHIVLIAAYAIGGVALAIVGSGRQARRTTDAGARAAAQPS
jgi:hypothetical protein